MSESYVQVPADGAGKKMRTYNRTVGANSVHEQSVNVLDGSGNIVDPRQVTIQTGSAAIGKLAANSGVDIGDVDVTSISAGSNIIGQVGIDQTTPGTTNRVDIGAALPAGSNAIGKLAANSGVDIGDVDVLSLPNVTIGAALPAGSNAIGKLAANSGVDIGDVDVTSVVPGTGATNLGKAEDAAHASGDTGVMVLAIRDDTLDVRSGAENDYEPLHTDSSGRLHVVQTASLPAGTAAIGKLAANSGVDIGDVDVATCGTITPGTAATNLGKAEDAAHGSGDTGVMVLAVRDDTLDVRSGTENDYEPLHTDATGRLYVASKHDGKAYLTAVFDASASGTLVAAVAGKVCKLHAMTIQAQGTVTVNLNNGSGGASLMEWKLQDREGAVLPMAQAPAYWAITSANTILYVTLSAAITVTITAIYSVDDAS